MRGVGRPCIGNTSLDVFFDGPVSDDDMRRFHDFARDGEARIERLRRILARYGDRVPMAMCHRADWQQEIDEALAWVADHPEPLEGVHHNLAPADAAKLDGFIREELGRDDPDLGRESTLRPGFYEGDME